MLGSSYEGFTVVMALVNPHPALKVAAPMSPMVDGWMGDDWFHYGAFRQTNFDYYYRSDDRSKARAATSARAAVRRLRQLPARRLGGRLREGRRTRPVAVRGARPPSIRPTTRSGQNQALDKTMAAQPLKVPMMWIQGIWDQEDMWGAIHSYLAMEPKDTGNTMNFLVMGPWRHSQVNYDGSYARRCSSGTATPRCSSGATC